MMYRTHVVAGSLCGFVLSRFLPLDAINQALVVAMSILGSLIPDIDHPRSYLGRRLIVFSFGFNKLFGHRKLLHSPVFYGILFAILALLNVVNIVTLLSLLVGILSHILLDMLNPQGVPIFYPISKKHYRILSIRTSSLTETVFMFGLVAVHIFLVT